MIGFCLGAALLTKEAGPEVILFQQKHPGLTWNRASAKRQEQDGRGLVSLFALSALQLGHDGERGDLPRMGCCEAMNCQHRLKEASKLEVLPALSSYCEAQPTMNYRRKPKKA